MSSSWILGFLDSWILGEKNRNKCLIVVIVHINLFILK